MNDAVLKILKMVEDKILTPEQAERLIHELKDDPKGGATGGAGSASAGASEPGANPGGNTSAPADPFAWMADLGRRVAEDLGRAAQDFQRQVNGAFTAPKNNAVLVFKTWYTDPEREKSRISLPVPFFQAFRTLLTQPQLFGVSPLVDFAALYAALDRGEVGKIAEYLDADRKERLEIWVEAS